MSLLKLDYCGKKFSRGNTVIGAVQPTAVAFDEGVHVIYGKGGAGKSTLLHMMAGMEPPSDRRGVRIRRPRSAGTVPQGFCVFVCGGQPCPGIQCARQHPPALAVPA